MERVGGIDLWIGKPGGPRGPLQGSKIDMLIPLQWYFVAYSPPGACVQIDDRLSVDYQGFALIMRSGSLLLDRPDCILLPDQLSELFGKGLRLSE
jgi:hypothetical protein